MAPKNLWRLPPEAMLPPFTSTRTRTRTRTRVSETPRTPKTEDRLPAQTWKMKLQKRVGSEDVLGTHAFLGPGRRVSRPRGAGSSGPGAQGQ